jgi:hypothetical protein
MRVFTLDDITHLPAEFGDSGWFYGLVRDRESQRVGLYEIFPGLGYGKPFYGWRPKIYWWIARDIFKQLITLRQFLRISEMDYEARKERHHQERAEAKTLEEWETLEQAEDRA